MKYLQEAEAKLLFASDQSVNETVCCHLCIFDVSHHKLESETLMSSALVRKKN